MNKKLIALVAAFVGLFLISGVSGAVAGSLITSTDIKDGTIKAEDLRVGLQSKIEDHGKDGKDGKDSLFGAVYRVENYKNGGAGDATVACADDEATSKKYTAVAGGVQAGGVQAMGQSSDFDVAGSFPGRMDWNTGQPKPNRLDGWIVLGSGGWSGTLKVWALCVPTTSIPVQQVDLDN